MFWFWNADIRYWWCCMVGNNWVSCTRVFSLEHWVEVSLKFSSRVIVCSCKFDSHSWFCIIFYILSFLFQKYCNTSVLKTRYLRLTIHTCKIADSGLDIQWRTRCEAKYREWGGMEYLGMNSFNVCIYSMVLHFILVWNDVFWYKS